MDLCCVFNPLLVGPGPPQIFIISIRERTTPSLSLVRYAPSLRCVLFLMLHNIVPYYLRQALLPGLLRSLHKTKSMFYMPQLKPTGSIIYNPGFLFQLLGDVCSLRVVVWTPSSRLWSALSAHARLKDFLVSYSYHGWITLLNWLLY